MICTNLHHGNLLTPQRNFDIHTRQNEWELILSTLQEAISLTRRRHIYSIWLDAPCIIQNDSRDWNREVVRMEAYDQSAWLVIVGHSSSNAKSGLFGPRLFAYYEGKLNPITFHNAQYNFAQGY
ncbi:uncharacterized protein BO80DRAFT_450737 [Aspergillus ibericus CBS 121593]|uniref:Heterokaryon incompatibility domain-containing protein n=1 Tax=Aspergillus ibericus CBS 121593 TaxID=1448316 RepID=A0A395GJB2_9EURO|nr:hypothetical protein BO80DRAFT_450737 [Aspergillus ibericus CBS 121593]RAK94847.1 hypothetical protein BO80DRAFT_450737 [Aspergillus ibericus CBS 121593]